MSKRFDAEIAALEHLMADKEPVTLTVPLDDLFIIFSSLQFAASDRRLTDGSKAQLARIGKQLGRYIQLRYPDLSDDMDKGW